MKSVSPRTACRGWILGAVLVPAIGLCWWRISLHESGAPLVDRVPDAARKSRNLNARPGVAYVGDKTCARCHAEIAEDYRKHPMGRSTTLADMSETPEVGDRPATFDAQGYLYVVERRDGKLIHSETRRDSGGGIAGRVEAEVRFVLGSGAKGKSYLIERDGRLFQSPISWYSAERRWSLSPGYERRNQHFERPIRSGCLYCHANGHTNVPGTINNYHTPIFQGLAIGCERCHGPGELHARLTDHPSIPDLTIVNPSRLEPSLREAVCEQCHLQGTSRVERFGREVADYRPGLPLSEYLSVFVPADNDPEASKEVGHVEQMHVSRCYIESKGRLGCVSCHDPHRLPSASERVAHYRDRCLNCHGEAEKGCGLPRTERIGKSPDDNCIQCHMPRTALKEIVHTAATDHRIMRRETSDSSRSVPRYSSSEGVPLSPFHLSLVDSRAPGDAERDLGVAMSLWAYNEPGPLRSKLARLAEPRLSEAIRRRPNDLAALEAQAIILAPQGRDASALAAFEAVLRIEPDRELALVGATIPAALLGRRAEALDYIRRAIRINPWTSSYKVTLANLFAIEGDWVAAAAACRDALRLDPSNLEARRLLIRSAVERRDLATVRAECLIFLAFDPPDADRYRRFLGR